METPEDNSRLSMSFGTSFSEEAQQEEAAKEARKLALAGIAKDKVFCPFCGTYCPSGEDVTGMHFCEECYNSWMFAD